MAKATMVEIVHFLQNFHWFNLVNSSIFQSASFKASTSSPHLIPSRQR